VACFLPLDAPQSRGGHEFLPHGIDGHGPASAAAIGGVLRTFRPAIVRETYQHCVHDRSAMACGDETQDLAAQQAGNDPYRPHGGPHVRLRTRGLSMREVGDESTVGAHCR
jgi:hypothetical protein